VKKAIKVIGIVVGVLFVLMIAAVIIIPKLGLPEGEVNIEVGEIDLSNVSDGTYSGSCDAGLVKVDVTVDVKDNAITSIVINKHNNGLGKKAEKIVDSILKEQSLAVDAVSGATISSDAIRKAIENALG
jgi:uncharacterized protein with FMN-binding domain